MENILLLGAADDALVAAAAARRLRFVSYGSTALAALVLSETADVECRLPSLRVLDGGPSAIVAALDEGADDAVAADSPADLIAARLAALTRRAARQRLIECGDVQIDRVERRVTRNRQAIALLPREYALLLHFIVRAGALVSREELHGAVWGLGFDPGTNVIEVHVSRLRAKLDRGFAWPMLRTERGLGYRLVPEGAPDTPVARSAAAS